MNEKRLFSELQRIIDPSALVDIEEKIVYQAKNGDYHLFGQYTIYKKNQDYRVTRQHVFGYKVFSELKTAVVWATLDKLNRVYDANRVIELDRLLISTEGLIQLHKKLSKDAKDLSSYELYIAKLSEDQLKRSQVLEELNGYVMETKSWQNRKFKTAAK
jgi:hypothetical protein